MMTGSRGSSGRALLAFGRSTSMPAASMGAVIMNTIRSTSTTSTKGVMLMSATGSYRPPPLLGEMIGISACLDDVRRGPGNGQLDSRLLYEIMKLLGSARERCAQAVV